MENLYKDLQLTQWEHLLSQKSHDTVPGTTESQESPSGDGASKNSNSLGENQTRYIPFQEREKTDYYGDSRDKRKKRRLDFESSADTPPRETKYKSFRIRDLEKVEAGSSLYSILCVVLQASYESDRLQRLLVGDTTMPHLILDLWSGTAFKAREQEFDAGDILFITRVRFRKASGILRGCVSAAFGQQSETRLVFRIGDSRERNDSRMSLSGVSDAFFSKFIGKVSALVKWVQVRKSYLYAHKTAKVCGVNNKENDGKILKLSLIHGRNLVSVAGKVCGKIKKVDCGRYKSRVFFFLDDQTTDRPVPVQLWDEHAKGSSVAFLNDHVGEFISCHSLKPRYSIVFNMVSLHSTMQSEFHLLQNKEKQVPHIAKLAQNKSSESSTLTEDKRTSFTCIDEMNEDTLEGIKEFYLQAYISDIIGLNQARLCCSKCLKPAKITPTCIQCSSDCSAAVPTGDQVFESSLPKSSLASYPPGFGVDLIKRDTLSLKQNASIPGFKWIVRPFQLVLCDEVDSRDSRASLSDLQKIIVNVGNDSIDELLFLSADVLSSRPAIRSLKEILLHKTNSKLKFFNSH